MSMLVTKLFLAVAMKPRPAVKERGDVPGWVLITVMTAGLVVALWTFAEGQLKALFERALDSVSKQ